jgi:hypothetical protein
MRLLRFSLRLVAALFALSFVLPAHADAFGAAESEFRASVENLKEEFQGKGVDLSGVGTRVDQVVETAKSGGASKTSGTADEDGGVAAAPQHSDEEIIQLEDAAKIAKDKEQSTANKILGSLSMAATGIGGMQLMQGLAEKQADEAGAADMAAYLQTIRCGIGGAKNVQYNQQGQTPVGPQSLFDAQLDYVTIARKMKTAKEELGMAPGIESELATDISALYTNRGTDADGIQHRFDTATQRAESKSGEKRAIAGGVAAGVGIVGGLVGNSAINGKLGEMIKEGKEKAEAKKKEDEKEKAEKAAAAEKKARESRLPSAVVLVVYNKIHNINSANHIVNQLKKDDEFMRMDAADKQKYVEGETFDGLYQASLSSDYKLSKSGGNLLNSTGGVVFGLVDKVGG